jgi:exosortase A
MNMMGRIAAESDPSAPPATDIAAPPPAALGWRPALVVLGLGLVAWGLLFGEEIAAAVRVWNSSTAYNHCWLIAPIAAWLFWQRRHRLEGLAPAPTPPFALLAIPGAMAWLVAERLGIMEGRQLVAFGLAQVLVLAVLGWPFVRAFAGPLAYLLFLVPFGAFAVPVLQQITASFIEIGLGLLGITHFVDGMMIETPAGLFHVAEACAGLRFIIAALAFGALYALVIFRSFWRRAIVMGLALVVPIIANGFRALGIIVAAEWIGSAEAAVANHVAYGWGFFSVIILLLILAGLPFREDSAPPAPRRGSALPPRPARPGKLATAGVLVVALIAAGPAVAASLAHNAGPPAERALPLAAPAGCISRDGGTTLLCDGVLVTARMLEFSPQANWSTVGAARWQAIGGAGDDDTTFTLPMPDGGAWQARQPAHAAGRASALGTWLNGRPAGHGLTARLTQARNALLGGGRPVLVAVVLRPDPAASFAADTPQTRSVLEAVLAAQGEALVSEAAALSRGR